MKIEKKYIYSGLFVLLIIIYFFSNIKGYYRFHQLCAIEQDKQFINMVEPDKGWLYNNGFPIYESRAYRLAASPNVSYVRFKNKKDNQYYDIRYASNQPAPLSEMVGHSGKKELYQISDSDMSQIPVYNWVKIRETLPKEFLTNRNGDKIVDMRTGELVAYHINIYYGLFDFKKIFSAAPSGFSCDWFNTYLGSEHNIHLIFGPLEEGSK